MSDAVRAALHAKLLAWYARSRRDLPWRRTRDPYSVWLSEVMLQQTRVETVIPYYERFLARWPTVHALAEAPESDVLAAWSGLGYYRRARMLHEGARAIAAARAFPATAQDLGRVKGIGRYTAGAVASIAFGEAAPLVDGNVARVLARVFAMGDDVKSARGTARLWALATALVHGEDPGAWNQALMELGATVCAPREPRCLLCPIHAECTGRARGLERELPRAAPKAKPRVQARWAVVATRADEGGGAVLLARRARDARFGGLWEPPSIDREPDESEADDADARGAIARLRALTGARFRDVERAGDVVHVLSHRRLETAVLRATLVSLGPPRFDKSDYEEVEVVPVATLASRGVSTLARKILDAANVG